MCHAKKVRILNPELFKCYLGATVEALEFNDYEMSDACAGGNLTKDDLAEQQIKKDFARQRKKLKPRQKKSNWMSGYYPVPMLEANAWANS